VLFRSVSQPKRSKISFPAFTRERSVNWDLFPDIAVSRVDIVSLVAPQYGLNSGT
jgi:hypothetical protein